MAGVHLKGIVKRYGKGDPVLKGIDLDVEESEFMVLVGPSGCGKSTILRVVSGLEEIDSGEIRIGERVVNDAPPRERDIAMVFQNYALYPHLKVYDNIAFGLRVRKTPKEEIDTLVREAAELLNLGSMLDKLPKELSGGERQRVALGRAIVRKPKAFLFDEPLSNLDAKLRVQMRAEISALHQRLKITTLYVTHDQVEAMTMGERITVLESGEIQQTDVPMGLYERPANRFVGTFIGSPPMNILDARLDGGRLAVGECIFSAGVPDELRNRADSRGFLLGIRPEHLEVHDRPEGLRATIDLIEPMGGESNIYLSTGAGRVVATMPGIAVRKRSDEVFLRFDPAAAHFFDSRSGVRLGEGSVPGRSG